MKLERYSFECSPALQGMCVYKIKKCNGSKIFGNKALDNRTAFGSLWHTLIENYDKLDSSVVGVTDYNNAQIVNNTGIAGVTDSTEDKELDR